MLNNKIFLNYSSEDIVWDGPNISCINLCQGDVISNVIYDVAIRLCEIVNDIDSLKDLDLECIIDKCNETLCIEDHSLVNLLRLLQHNDCELKTLIDAVSNDIIEKKNIKLNLDLSCLKECPDYKVPQYNFLCANGGVGGDSISVTYNTLYNPAPITVTLKTGQCIKFDLPAYKVTILNSTVITSGSNIQAEVIDSIGFDNCPNCNLYINNLIDDISFPGYHKQKEFTLNNILQYLIYRICCHEYSLNSVELKLSDLEVAYNRIVTTFSSYIEPKLSTCINNTPLVHSLLTTRLSNYICDVRSNIGTTLQIQNSIAAQCNAKWISTNFPHICPGFPVPSKYLTSVLIDGNTYILNQYIYQGEVSLVCSILNNNLPKSLAQFYVHSSGQIEYNNIASSVTIFMLDCDGITPISVNFNLNFINAVTLAEDSKNQWSVLCDILNRVKKQENSACCLPDCGELQFGYKFVYSESDQIYKLYFTKAYGTKIPEGWSDNGSILTIKDVNGAIYTTSITITDNTEVDIDLDGLISSKEMNVSIKTNFIHDNGLVCKDVLTGHLDAIISSTCSFCKICAYGSNPTDQIKLFYYTSNNLTVRSQILNPGSCITFKLPDETPTISSIINITPESDIIIAPDPSTQCAEDIILPEPIIDTCWIFPLPSLSTDWFIQEVDYNPLAPLIASGLFVNQTSGDVLYKFGVNIDDNQMITYNKIITSVHPNGLTLSGNIGEFFYLGDNAGSKKQAGEVNVKLPQVSGVSEILSSKKCGTIIYRRVPSNGSAGHFDNPTTGYGLGLKGEVQVANEQDLSFDLNTSLDDAGMTREINGTFGLILSLQGQDVYNPPSLIIQDAVTGNMMTVIGQLQEESCDCPS